MIKLLKVFLKLLVVLALLFGILFLASQLLEQKIVDKAITIINDEVEVPIYIEKISFSLIKKFPYASLELKNFTVLSAKKFNRSNFSQSFPDTLIFIEELYLSVNLRPLLDNRLDITKAYAHNGQINILVDKNGNENYNIFREIVAKNNENKPQKNLMFLLDQIQVEDVEFRFINKFKNTGLSIYAPHYTLKGQFYKKEYTATTSGKLLLNYFEQGQIKVYPENPAKINMKLNVSNHAIDIIESSFETKEFQCAVNGTVNLNEPVKLDLKVTGNTNNLDGFIGLVTDKNPKKFSTNGQLAISAVIKGIISTTKSPAIAVNFKLLKGSISESKQKLDIDKIELLGSYTNGDQRNLSTSRIDINNFLFEMNKSSLSGKLTIRNFNNPLFTLSAKTSLQLNDLDVWISNKADYLFDGKVIGDIYCEGHFDTKKDFELANFKNWQKKANLMVTDGMFKMKNPQLSIEGLSANAVVLNNKIVFNNLVGNIQSSNIKVDASIDDYFSLFIDSLYPLKINGNVIADQIEYKKFEHFFESDESNSERRDINIDCSFETDKLVYDKLVAEKVSGNLNFFNEQLQITDLKFKTMEGQVSGSINYFPQNGNKYLFQTHAITKHVNIKSFFSTFNNFEQTFITADNLEGYLTSNFDLEMIFKNGKVDTSTIELIGHARIDNGKLLNFEPIREISKYSEIEELNNIKFSKFENDILISNSTVHIPKMDISSSAFDISLYGTQKFSGDYEYHIKLFLSDLLGGKSKRLAKQQSEFGTIEDDGNNRTLYLLATQKNGVNKVKLDSDEIKGSIKTEIKKEKKEFKKALHDEFGWFKKDTTLHETQKNVKKPKFVIEWDEE